MTRHLQRCDFGAFLDLCILTVFCLQATVALSLENPSTRAKGSAEADFVRPLPIHIVNPQFPKESRGKDRTGEMELTARVATDGTVKDVVVNYGDPNLVNFAIEAVKQWKYVPAMRGGSVVEGDSPVRFKYNLGKHVCIPEQPSPNVEMAPREDLLGEIAAGKIVPGIGNGTTPPKPIHAPDPEYSESARQDRFQGSLLLGVVV
jgi:TonB family protein